MSACVYRFFDAWGRLAYIGSTIHLKSRVAEHKRCAHWFREPMRIEVEACETKADASARERAAILRDQPPGNRQLVTGDWHGRRVYQRYAAALGGAPAQTGYTHKVHALCAQTDAALEAAK